MFIKNTKNGAANMTLVNEKNLILQRDNEHIFSSLGDKVDNFRRTRILVTGAKGFLGKTIVSFLRYLNCVHFDNADQLEIIAVDYDDFDICNDMSSYIPEGTLDYIINCAGIASPKKYLKSPLKTLDVSYEGTKNIFNLAMMRNTRSLVLFSSSEVYGTPPSDQIPTKEEYIGQVTTFGNRSCYDIGKNVLETLSYVYHQQYGLPVNVLRPFNIYGPLMDLHDGRIIPNICKAMVTGNKFSVYGNGKQTRTYCYVADAMVYIFESLFSSTHGNILNIGSKDEELSALELAEKAYSIIDHTESSYEIVPYPDEYPDEEPTRRCPNISKIQDLTGYVPAYNFEQGFSSCYEYFKGGVNE
jgi:UDP-glucuronate decarboxylase